MYRLAIAFAAYGVVLLVLAARELAVPGPAAGTTPELSLQTLLDAGPAAHPHVVLTNFDFTTRFVHVEGRFQSGWRCVWFVVAPERTGPRAPETDVQTDTAPEFLGGDGAAAPPPARVQRPMPKLASAPQRVRALVMSKELRSDIDLGLFIQHHQNHLPGAVTLAAESLSHSDREFLKQQFSGIDLSSCLLIHVDGAQRDSVLLVALVLGAGFCFVTSGVLVRRARGQPGKAPAAPRPVAPLDPEEEEALYLWQREQHQRRPPSNYV